ncbi:Calmodulin-binding domain, plant [Dillenia turbinata]|uniref:Calmodulin-binding domain, plant n=1 Tax=Dillenia turbinata TaxID=194707 RepID=A0AAN8UDA3_9MAGN
MGLKKNLIWAWSNSFESDLSCGVDMAISEARTSLPGTPERRKTYGGNSRRNSIGNPTPLRSGEHASDHHLRASTGSCHDFCKYGRKHEFEAKTRNPVPKRVPTSMTDSQNSVEKFVLPERKKSTVAKGKPSTHHSVTLLEQNTVKAVKQVAAPRQAESSGKEALPKNRRSSFPAKLDNPLQPKPAIPKLSSFASPSNNKSSENKKGSESKTIRKAATVEPIKKVLGTPTTSLSPKTSLTRVASLNARKHRSVKVVSTVRNHNKVMKVKSKKSDSDEVEGKRFASTVRNNDSLLKAEAEKAEDVEVEEKTVHVIEMETGTNNLESAQSESKFSFPSVLIPSEASPESSLHPDTPSFSSQFHEYKEEEEEEEVKEDGVDGDGQEDQEESDYDTTDSYDSISEYDETDGNNGEILEVDQKNGRRKAGIAHSQNNDSAAVKLNFRRGKVVDLQSDNNGPRRLRFRQGRVLEVNPNGNVGARRTFKKTEGIEANGDEAASEKVVLRHQDMQGKKDAQGLFNNLKLICEPVLMLEDLKFTHYLV